MIKNYLLISLLVYYLLFIGINASAVETGLPSIADVNDLAMRTTVPNAEIRNTTFQIEATKSDGSYKPRGTGFIINYEGTVYAITARHIIQKSTFDEKLKKTIWGEFSNPIFIRLLAIDPSIPLEKRHQRVAFGDFGSFNKFYFSYEDVDLAVFPLNFSADFQLSYKSIPYERIQPDEKVQVGEDVHLLGFPGDLAFQRGESLVRKGTISFKVNKYYYILDANAWPGDSGGLVISAPYFGLTKDSPPKIQYDIGGKIVGVELAYQFSGDQGLPKELQGFAQIISGQAILDIFKMKEFKEYHENVKKTLKTR